MVRFILLPLLATLALSAGDCNKKKTSGKYKGKLEIKALCMNYTISVIEGDMPADSVAKEWTDENTQVRYRNAFKLGNPCDFPPTIKQGDEFFFVIDTTKGRECAVCMAYYPTPPKALRIKVVD
jgi:hypothetical protein